MPTRPTATLRDDTPLSADEGAPPAGDDAPPAGRPGRARQARGRLWQPRLPAASFQAIRDRRLARRETLEVRLTFRLRLGAGADERLTLLDDRRVPLVGSVFERRDDILRAFALLMAKGLMLQPKLLRGIAPVLRFVRHLPRPAVPPLRQGRAQ